jgi:transposase
MVAAEEEGAGRPIRRWRTLSEKRRIAELTFEPGASVAVVARANGVNANQVFKWRRLLKRGELGEPATSPTSFLPVMLSAPSERIDAGDSIDPNEQSAPGGSIHIEFPGKAMISVERGADPVLLRSILESLRK